jgi:hypothetical protein
MGATTGEIKRDGDRINRLLFLGYEKAVPP